jgi:cobalt-zinc-cadmium efflux system outer membrane protein
MLSRDQKNQEDTFRRIFMCLKYFTPFGLALVLGLTGCATHRMDVAWPEPRPLGKDFATYRPPHRPSAAASASLELEEPSGVITLRQALSMALMKNPELKAFSWEVRAREARTLQARLLPNPEPGVEAENLGGSGAFQDFDGTETTFQLSQLIELGGKRSKRTRVAALERDLAGWDYESKRLDVLTEVTKAFVDVLAAQERLALTEELVHLAGQVFNTVSERVRSGKVSPVEETKASVALATSRIEIERARRGLEAARKRLAATWGSTSPTFEKVDGQLDVVKPIPPAEQLVRRISQNPDIVRWVAEMEQRKAAVKLEDAKRIPDLTLSGGFRRFSETNDNAFVLGVSIPLPLFDRNQGGALEARYRLAKADEERKASEVRVGTGLVEAYQTLSTAFAEATALKNDVLPGAQSAFGAANEGYRQGKFGYLDVLDAQRTLFETRDQYIETLAAYHRAVADVEQLIGERLDAVKNTPE